MTWPRIFGFSLSIICLLACQPDTESTAVRSYTNLDSTALATGLRQGDDVLSDSMLQTVLPALFTPYETLSQQGKSFQSKFMGFSQAEAIYHLADQQYLSIRLADYHADSSGFVHLYKQFQAVNERPEGRTVPAYYPDSFFWSWYDPQTGVRYLEGGLFYRFHLQIRTNQTNGIVPLENAVEQLDWQALRRIAKKEV